MKWSRLNRDVHRWGAVLVAIPLLVVIVTGVILQWKKQSDWVQPPTQKGTGTQLSLTFDEVLSTVQQVPEADVETWQDIDRLDVRPGKGMLKVRCRNRCEVQLDAETGAVLQVAWRRSDLIESIHDGSFFHEHVKLWIFFPSALVLLLLWGTGIYLFFLPYLARRKKARARRQADVPGSEPTA